MNVPNHAQSGEVFERAAMLADRQPDDPHPFVDPESWTAWLDILMKNAQDKLEEERREERAAAQ